MATQSVSRRIWLDGVMIQLDGRKKSIGKFYIFPSFNAKDVTAIIGNRIGIPESDFVVFVVEKNRVPPVQVPLVNVNFVEFFQGCATWCFHVHIIKKPTMRAHQRAEPARAPCTGASGGGNGNCDECSKGTGEFHHCINDPVVNQNTGRGGRLNFEVSLKGTVEFHNDSVESGAGLNFEVSLTGTADFHWFN